MSSNTSPAPWFSDTGRNAVYDKRVWFDESGARFGDTPNLVVRIEGGRPADVHLIAAAPELLEALEELCACPQWVDEATVPKAGVEANPTQVVMNMSVGLVRLRKARAAIAKATEG